MQMEELLDVSAQELIDMSWQSREIDVLLTEGYDEIFKRVETLTLKGEPPQAETLPKLYDFLTKMLVAYGGDDLPNYFDMLKEAGETVVPEIENGIREMLVTQLGVSKDKVSDGPWGMLSQFAKVTGERGITKACWKGLVTEGSQIAFFETRTDKMEPPGKDFQSVRGQVVTFHHVSMPPISLVDAIKSEGKVIAADVTIFIAHTEERSSTVTPYVLRFWYDSKNRSWRPLTMNGFPNPEYNLPMRMIF
jgi:hypothetical protein